MIKLSRLNKSTIYLNPDLLKCIEETPDTMLTLINGDHYLVREKAQEVIGLIIDYRVKLLRLSQCGELQETGKDDGSAADGIPGDCQARGSKE